MPEQDIGPTEQDIGPIRRFLQGVATGLRRKRQDTLPDLGTPREDEGLGVDAQHLITRVETATNLESLQTQLKELSKTFARFFDHILEMPTSIAQHLVHVEHNLRCQFRDTNPAYRPQRPYPISVYLPTINVDRALLTDGTTNQTFRVDYAWITDWRNLIIPENMLSIPGEEVLFSFSLIFREVDGDGHYGQQIFVTRSLNNPTKLGVTIIDFMVTEQAGSLFIVIPGEQSQIFPEPGTPPLERRTHISEDEMTVAEAFLRAYHTTLTAAITTLETTFAYENSTNGYVYLLWRELQFCEQKDPGFVELHKAGETVELEDSLLTSLKRYLFPYRRTSEVTRLIIPSEEIDLNKCVLYVEPSTGNDSSSLLYRLSFVPEEATAHSPTISNINKRNVLIELGVFMVQDQHGNIFLEIRAFDHRSDQQFKLPYNFTKNLLLEIRKALYSSKLITDISEIGTTATIARPEVITLNGG